MSGGSATTRGKLITSGSGGVLVLTLNRPEVRNAIDTETAWAVSDALDELEADADPGRRRADRARAARSARAWTSRRSSPGRSPSVGTRGFAGIVERPPAKPDRRGGGGHRGGGRLRDRAGL